MIATMQGFWNRALKRSPRMFCNFLQLLRCGTANSELHCRLIATSISRFAPSIYIMISSKWNLFKPSPTSSARAQVLTALQALVPQVLATIHNRYREAVPKKAIAVQKSTSPARSLGKQPPSGCAGPRLQKCRCRSLPS